MSRIYCIPFATIFIGLPAVITIAPNSLDQTEDGYSFGDCLRKLEELGADVVGLNCFRGPDSMLPVIKEVREKCKVFFFFF